MGQLEKGADVAEERLKLEGDIGDEKKLEGDELCTLEKLNLEKFLN